MQCDFVFAYLRLSRDDKEKMEESNSIKNQRALLNDYMGKHPELHKFDEYVDDGYSGTNFERPDFKRMIKHIMEMRWQRNEMGQLYKVDFQQDPRRKSIQYDCRTE